MGTKSEHLQELLGNGKGKSKTPPRQRVEIGSLISLEGNEKGEEGDHEHSVVDLAVTVSDGNVYFYNKSKNLKDENSLIWVLPGGGSFIGVAPEKMKLDAGDYEVTLTDPSSDLTVTKSFSVKQKVEAKLDNKPEKKVVDKVVEKGKKRGDVSNLSYEEFQEFLSEAKKVEQEVFTGIRIEIALNSALSAVAAVVPKLSTGKLIHHILVEFLKNNKENVKHLREEFKNPFLEE